MSTESDTNWGEVRYCPGCGHTLQDARSLLNEFWVAEETVYFCWCFTCSWSGEIKKITRVVISEQAEEGATLQHVGS